MDEATTTTMKPEEEKTTTAAPEKETWLQIFLKVLMYVALFVCTILILNYGGPFVLEMLMKLWS